jgi:hypothetical protein
MTAAAQAIRLSAANAALKRRSTRTRRNTPILKPFYLNGFSLFPSRRVSALALRFRSFPAAQGAFVAPLLLLGPGDDGRYLQPSAVPVHGNERQISGRDLLARS